jgi:uncharacterized membrane protein
MENNSSEEHTVTETAPTITPAPTAEPNTSDTFQINETTVMAALSYFGPLVIIPFLVKKGDTFVAFHIKQGLVIFGFELVLYVLGGFMLHFIMPIISLINLILFILSIIGIINALQRKEKEIPFIGSYAYQIKL